jgi:GDP-L-fucose synthase
MKNILITGGTGMVGKNLQKSFANHNLQGFFVGRGKDNQYDLTDVAKTQQLFRDVQPDIVIHAGANVGGIGYNKKNPGALIRDNLKMGINVLDACVEFGVSQVYITSTCCSYPKFCPTPFSEDQLWNGAEEESNSSYGVAKKAIIKMSQSYRQQFGLKTTCFVLANLYGIYDHFIGEDNHVVPALIKKFLDAKENNSSYVECWGSGMASRDLFFSQDVSDILTQAVLTNFDHSEPINLGTGKEITIKDLAELIKELTEYQGEIVFNGAVSDGQPRRCLDVSRAKALLNWEAKIDLRAGLQATIEWYKANKDKL